MNMKLIKAILVLVIMSLIGLSMGLNRLGDSTSAMVFFSMAMVIMIITIAL